MGNRTVTGEGKKVGRTDGEQNSDRRGEEDREQSGNRTVEE